MIDEQHDRLKKARVSAGYETATAAAAALGVNVATYVHHENGTAGLSRAGARYAKFFKVDYNWLMTGAGEMRPKRSAGMRVPVRGRVGASKALVEWFDDCAEEPAQFVDFPEDGRLEALVVEGDSQYPRFLNGEFILIDPEPVVPNTLVDRYAVVQSLDGRRMIKMLRQGRRPGVWRLESHNSPPEDNVELLAAWRYLGVLPSKP